MTPTKNVFPGLTAKRLLEVSSHELLLGYFTMLFNGQYDRIVRNVESMVSNSINYVSKGNLGGQSPAVEYDWVLRPLPAINYEYN